MPAPLHAIALAAVLVGEGDVAGGDREPIALLVFSPKQGEAPEIGQSELMRSAARAIERWTGFQLVSPEQAGMDASQIARCPDDVRLSCWARSAARSGSGPRYLIVVGVGPAGGGRVRMTALMLDTEQARAEEDQAAEDLENRVFATAIKAEPRTLESAASEPIDAYFEALVTGVFRGEFERADQWQPFGAIEVECPRAGVLIQLDGRIAGQTRVGVTEIKDVRRGPHTIDLVAPEEQWTARGGAEGGAALFHATIDVTAGRTTRVAAAVPDAPDPSGRTLSRVAFWSGIGLATAGAAITAFAIVASPKTTELEVCAGCPPAEVRRAFASFCELTSTDPACLQGGKGVLAAPLGYSLMLSGATWTAGSLVFGEDADMTWLGLAVGLGAGVLSYGISAALDPGRD